MESLNNLSILVTGGTGSFGSSMVRRLLSTKASRIVVFSRDELKQQHLRENLRNDTRLRFFLGDIRDQDRLETALNGIDLVIHAAALKQVETGEYNPMEFVKSNVLGSQNVIEASIKSGVAKVIALSTDKASSPVNLYGATKLTADKLFTAANNYSFGYGTVFSVVRYGNVMGSRGSVVPYFLNLKKRGEKLTITDKRMTRFWISIEQAVDFVLSSFQIMKGGELYIPKIPSARILDIAKAISPHEDFMEIGIRPGEKLHEEMIAPDDSRRTVELGDRYVVNPLFAEWGYKQPEGREVKDGFSYRSDNNPDWLNLESLKKLVREFELR
jgi:UDP-N-acetylglucosamine 4,6-dehydratase